MTHVTLSPGMAESLRGGYRVLGSTLCLSNSAFIAVPAAVPERSGGHPCAVVLGHLSNLSKPKGLSEVLETFEKLLARDLDVELQLAGPANDPEDRSLIENIWSVTRTAYVS